MEDDSVPFDTNKVIRQFWDWFISTLDKRLHTFETNSWKEKIKPILRQDIITLSAIKH